MARKKVAEVEMAEAPTPEDTSELRDKIAIEVLNGYIAYMGCDPEVVGPMGNRTTEKNKDVLARASYAYADAMIKARMEK